MLYFLVVLNNVLLHADQLGMSFGGYNIRFGYAISTFLLLLLVGSSRLKIQIQSNRIVAVAAIICFTAVSVVWSEDPGRTASMAGLCAGTLLLYFFTPYLIVSKIGPIRCLKLYIFSAKIVGLYGLFQVLISLLGFKEFFVAQNIGAGISRANGFSYEPSFYLLYMVPVFSVLVVNLLFKTDSFVPQTYWSIFVFYIYCAASLSASLIGLPLAIGVLYLFLSWSAGQNVKSLVSIKIQKRAIGLFLLVGLVLVIVSMTSDEIARGYVLRVFLADDILEHHSTAERLVQVYNSYLAFLDAPFFGHGLGAVGQYLHDQYLGGRSLDFAASRPFEIDPTPRFFDPMNFTTELLASYGGFGTILYLYIYFIVISDAAKFIRMASTPKPHVRLVFSIFVAVVVMFLWQNINQGLYRTYTWFFLGMADAIRHGLFISSRREKFGATNLGSPSGDRSSISFW